MRTLEAALQERMREPEFKAAYEALEPEYAIIQAMIDARKQSGLTQRQLADRTGINQGDISKLENGSANPSHTRRHMSHGQSEKFADWQSELTRN